MSVDRPRVTVFTPSHRPRFLDDCYRSLVAQTRGDWEWVVVLNGGARWRPPTNDSRVRLVIADDLSGVGAVKQLACSVALGEFLLELDHDDLLASQAVEEVVAAFEANPHAGLAYSDGAQIREDGTRDDGRFDERHGWEYYETVVDGRHVLACRALEPSPHNVSYIWYAPNHLRAYRRSTYLETDGYDPSLVVLDDQDLMSKLYLRADFVHIPRCLYLQRVHDGNTWRSQEHNAAIQRDTVGLYDKYALALTTAWADRLDLPVLELAAPDSPGGDLASPDEQVPSGRVDPSMESTVGAIVAHDVLPRVSDPVLFFNNAYRLLVHGGVLFTATPSTDGRGAFENPAHVSFFNENSFWYYTDRDYSRFLPELDCRFLLSRLATHYPSEWHERNEVSYVMANLVAIKDGPRQGGLANH